MNDEYERLTNDAKYLLLQLSSKYLESVTDGKSKSDATTMGSTQQVRDDVMPQWSLPDVSFTMAELRDAGFMKLWPGDGCYYNSFITTQAMRGVSKSLAMMSKRFLMPLLVSKN